MNLALICNEILLQIIRSDMSDSHRDPTITDSEKR